MRATPRAPLDFKGETNLLPRRYAHFVQGMIQSCLTCGVTAGIAATRSDAGIGEFALSWLMGWAAIAPIVLIATPSMRRLAELLTRPTDAHPDTL
jgi:hypothetical protein